MNSPFHQVCCQHKVAVTCVLSYNNLQVVEAMWISLTDVWKGHNYCTRLAKFLFFSWRDEIIRQERPIHEAADRSTTSDAYETSRYSPSRFKTSQYSGHHQSPQKTNEDQLQEELTVLDGLNDRLMEKLTRTESRLESVQLHKDEMSLETEAKIAARGAGRFFLFFG